MHDFPPPLFCRVRFPVSFLLLSFTAVLRRQKTSLRKIKERISPQNEGGEEIAEIGSDTLAVKMKLRRMSSSSSRKVYPFSSGKLFGRICSFLGVVVQLWAAVAERDGGWGATDFSLSLPDFPPSVLRRRERERGGRRRRDG